MHALVIDDARVMRALLRGTMQQLGFEVSEACTGREGLDRLRGGQRPDVVLVDCIMPEMDGYEFIRTVRSDPSYAGLRMLLVSGETDSAAVRRALDEGADGYVVKPFNRDIIRDKLTGLGVKSA